MKKNNRKLNLNNFRFGENILRAGRHRSNTSRNKLKKHPKFLGLKNRFPRLILKYYKERKKSLDKDCT